MKKAAVTLLLSYASAAQAQGFPQDAEIRTQRLTVMAVTASLAYKYSPAVLAKSEKDCLPAFNEITNLLNAQNKLNVRMLDSLKNPESADYNLQFQKTVSSVSLETALDYFQKAIYATCVEKNSKFGEFYMMFGKLKMDIADLQFQKFGW